MLSAVLLIVQGWLDFKPDLIALGNLKRDIYARSTILSTMSGSVVTAADIEPLQELCNKFLKDNDSALADTLRDPQTHSRLATEKKKVAQIVDALTSPLEAIPATLQSLLEDEER